MSYGSEFVGENVGRLEYALSFPFASDQGTFRALAAVVGLSLLSLALVPMVLLGGYLLRVREAAARQQPSPPAFDGAWETAKEGVGGSMALFPLFLVSQIGVALFDFVYPPGAIVFFLALLYYTPAFLTVYSVERSATRLYFSGTPFRMAHSVPYLLGGLVFVPVSVGLLIVAVSVDLVLLVPLFLVFCTLPLFTAGYWGYVYSETVGRRKYDQMESEDSFFDDDLDLDD